jgi:hypothetical protein
MTKKEVKFTLTAKDKTKAAFKSARKGINKLGKAGAAAGLAFGASVVAGYASAAADIDKLAKKSSLLNIPVQELQKLRFAAEQTGVGVQTLDTGIQRMTRRISEATTGTGVAVKALEELNVPLESIQNLQPQEQFKVIADAMEGVKNNSDKVRLSMALFDTEGVALLNTMKGGADAIDQVGDSLDKFGILLDEVDTKKIEMANDSFAKSRRVLKGVGQQMGVALAPIVGGLTERFLKFAEGVGGVDALMQKLAKVTIRAMGFMADAVHYVKLGFMGLGAIIGEVVQQVLKLPIALASLGDSILGKMGFDAESLRGAQAGMEGIQASIQKFQEMTDELAMQASPGAGVIAMFDDIQASFEQRAIAAVEKGKIIANAEVETEAEKNSAIERLHEQHLSKLAKMEAEAAYHKQRFEEANHRGKIKMLASHAVQLTQGAAGSSRKLFKINQAAALSNAAVNMPEHISQTMAKYPYPYSVFMGGLAAAASLAQMNAIRKQKYGGGGGSIAPSLAGTGGGATPTFDVNNPATLDTVSGEVTRQNQSPSVQVIMYGNNYGFDDFQEAITEAVANASDANQLRITDSTGRLILERT